MSDEKIIAALETFNLPVGNKRIYENELDDYNYFVFRRGGLVESGCGRYVRKIYISYVFQGEQKISDFEIINKIRKLGLNFNETENDDFQLADTNDWIDMITFTFERPERG
jgi:hypothetical protein|nr:MAG TPA: hypothetical protein [Caudoviricetes sp.]